MMRVFILAGIRLYRDGLVDLLGRIPSLVVAGAADDEHSALDAVRTAAPDVVLLDVGIPHSYGVARQLRASLPCVRVIAVGVDGSDTHVVACAEAGVAGYLTREASLDELVATLDRAVKGELLCSPRAAFTLAHRLATLVADRDDRPGHVLLTRREREIVELLAADLSNKEIAVRLRIEVATVKNHVHNLMEKLQIHRRADAARALRRGASHRRAVVALEEPDPIAHWVQ